MKRKKVLDYIDIDTDIFMTSFDNAAKLLLEKKEELESQGWSSIHLILEQHYTGADLVCKGMRAETDGELAYRVRLLKMRKDRAAAKEKREKQQYEKLKAKYEK